MDTSAIPMDQGSQAAPGTGSDNQAMHPAIRLLSFAARMLLAIVFIVSGAGKIGSLSTFAHSIAAYQMLPESLANIAALAFVWTELAIGILLFAGAAIRGSALLSSALLVVFLIAVITAIARGLNIDCGCFPGAPEPVGIRKVLEDLGLLAAAIFLIYFPKSFLSIDTLLRRQGAEGEA
ncbi:MAG: DoxX family membrane protein [Bacteroidetes bacterium]|nr:DoxX family membrane protein [Bacteroidota bacterium]